MKTVAKDGKLYAEVTLRDVIERTEDFSGLPMLSEIKRLYDENAKLRELVADMWFWHYEGHIDSESQEEQMEHIDGVLDRMRKLGIEEAVEATLGSGECRMYGYADAAFRVVAAPDETDYVDYAEVCECSACGADVIIPNEYERVTAGDDRLWPTYNYCPNCGRKVER